MRGAKVAMEVFMPQEYWTLAGEMKAAAAGGDGGQQNGSCVAKLVQVGGLGGGGRARGSMEGGGEGGKGQRRACYWH